MNSMERYSPVRFPTAPTATTTENGWRIALAYPDEGQDPGVDALKSNYIYDLSHRPKWDVQGSDLSAHSSGGFEFPERPNGCLHQGSFLACRRNRTQASIWQIAGETASMPADAAYTDVTDGLALLAITGADVPFILEKLTALDLFSPQAEPPFLVQGPIAHVPCQIVRLPSGNGVHRVIFSFSRGYGYTMAEAVTEAGREWGLKPAGQERSEKIMSRDAF